MKLYQVKDKTDRVALQFVMTDFMNPKTYLESINYIKPDLRTLKELDFPEGRFEVTDLDFMRYIFFDGKCIVTWNDEAHCDYPEDLTWDRDISTLISQIETLKDLEWKKSLRSL